MDYLEHNRRSWNTGVMARSVWAQPVDDTVIERARTGDWSVLLTPKRPVPRGWFGDLAGRRVLCLAAGGGQQVPVLAAAGASVVSFDLSDEQLRKDEQVAKRHALAVQCVRGDMAELRKLADGAFDLVFHPASNSYVRSLAPVWSGCHRVLRAHGALLAGFMNPAVFLFDHDEAGTSGALTVRHSLPYSDEQQLAPERLSAKVQAGEPLQFSHSLAEQIGGQIDAGFAIAGLYEDHWYDDSWPFSNVSPVCLATRALRDAEPASS